MNLFDISLKFNGFPVKKANRVFNNINKLNNEDFIKYLEKQKKDIVNYHLNNNLFYKSLAEKININDWSSIPILTKKDLQQPINNRLSKGYTKKNCHVHKTSGSSGTPFIFAKDKFSHALTWSVFKNRFSWYNLNINTSKQARFYGIPLNKKGYYKERFKDTLANRFRFSVFDLSDNQLEKNLNKFKRTSFDYINGYTSSIVQFAKYLERKQIVLKSVCPSLKVCIVTSEMLYKIDKNLLEKQFGIPIVNEYGAAELGLIAFQNTLNQWLINSTDLYVEIVDESGAILPYGNVGRVVITSLYNKAHPFIRYDLGDIGMLSKDSTLQKPILEKLIGRTNDIAILPSGKKAAGLTFYYVTKTIIEDKSSVKEFIIEQLELDTFKVSYVSSEVLSKEKLKKIKAAFDKYLESNLTVKFERKEKLTRAKSGKLKQFISHL
ncbi:phenylacetate--CoA ligase family protein [uncultured Lacinutrix sp.]|uniref:phenylacetate--CoA ligase family protein n=1 Tax=uncultured Lacinutrix sp. TaxID=574032 RepID=UPI0026103EAE|nr:phenylacetate--CoA ligase family protein [uncultured Lacinutrix sp.]